jgi:hypothetical protein
MYVQALAEAYIETQDTPNAEEAEIAANKFRARVLKLLAGEEVSN